MSKTAEKALKAISGGSVLDVATGGGGFITFLVENLKDFSEITGIDSDDTALQAAQKAHKQTNIRFLHMDAAQMEFPDDNFDMVCIANSLHHMADLPSVLSELLRVCKPGGRLVIREMYCDGQTETQLSHVYMHHWRAAINRAEGIKHHETFTRQQMVEMIEKLGLKNLRFYDSKNLSSASKDPELMRRLDELIDHFIQRSKTLENSKDFRLSGEQIRQRIHQVGFHLASSLMAIGEK